MVYLTNYHVEEQPVMPSRIPVRSFCAPDSVVQAPASVSSRAPAPTKGSKIPRAVAKVKQAVRNACKSAAKVPGYMRATKASAARAATRVAAKVTVPSALKKTKKQPAAKEALKASLYKAREQVEEVTEMVESVKIVAEKVEPCQAQLEPHAFFIVNTNRRTISSWIPSPRQPSSEVDSVLAPGDEDPDESLSFEEDESFSLLSAGDIQVVVSHACEPHSSKRDSPLPAEQGPSMLTKQNLERLATACQSSQASSATATEDLPEISPAKRQELEALGFYLGPEDTPLIEAATSLDTCSRGSSRGSSLPFVSDRPRAEITITRPRVRALDRKHSEPQWLLEALAVTGLQEWLRKAHHLDPWDEEYGGKDVSYSSDSEPNWVLCT